MYEQIARKMVIVFDKYLEKDEGFVVRALIKLAKTRKATILFSDYANIETVWEDVRTTLYAAQEDKLLPKADEAD